jgi:hypothetical protein
MSILITDSSFVQMRETIVQASGGIEEIKKLGWDEVARFELFPGQPIGTGVIVVPEDFLPPGRKRRLAARTFDLFGWLDASHQAWERRCEWMGRASLALWLPYRNARNRTTASASTWTDRITLLLRLVRRAIPLMREEEWDFWPVLRKFQDKRFKVATTEARNISKMDQILRILVDAVEDGVMLAPKSQFEAKESHVEKSYLREENDDRTVKKTLPGGKYKYFPNAFVSRLMNVCLWLQDNLSEQIIECWKAAEDAVNSSIEQLGPNQAQKIKLGVLQGRKWVDANGNSLTKLPFEFSQREGQKTIRSDAWPPTNWATIPLFVTLVQISNLSVLAFCTGGRHHEVAGMGGVAITGHNDLIRSRTYKYSRRLGGIDRDWPLHEIAARAVALQDKLASVLRPDGTSHLWVQTRQRGDSPRGTPLADLSEQSHQTLMRLGLGDVSDGRAHLHRWRHTIARLIGVTVDDAQEVIQDLFGHINVEHVLVYLLSNPDIAAEALQIAEETAFVMAQDAVKEVIAGTAGGPAADRLFVAVEDYRMQRGIKALGTDDIEEAAILLRLEGTAFRRVRRGILCTKAPGQLAPCTRGRGREDIGSCHTDCLNRLELQVERQAITEELRQLAEQYAQTPSEFEMIKERLAGQVLAFSRRDPEGREYLRNTLSVSDFARVFNDAT